MSELKDDPIQTLTRDQFLPFRDAKQSHLILSHLLMDHTHP